jgi:hypothetical protein
MAYFVRRQNARQFRTAVSFDLLIVSRHDGSHPLCDEALELTQTDADQSIRARIEKPRGRVFFDHKAEMQQCGCDCGAVAHIARHAVASAPTLGRVLDSV